MTTTIRPGSDARAADATTSSTLDRAHAHALHWLESVRERRVQPAATAEQVADALGRELPDDPTDPAEVVDLLATAAEPGLTAMGSPRFFGFVIGGSLPAALGADWLVSAWDQNAGLRKVTPAATGADDVASAWLLDLLGLPAGSAVGFATGATVANFTALAAARDDVLRRAGWDVTRRGLVGGPPVHVLVGAERHDSVDLVLRYLGLGEPVVVAADAEGRLETDALAAALDGVPDGEPTIVCLQAGNVHSGAFDPFADAIPVARAHGAWVHVDGAFGLWAAAAPTYRHLTAGADGADSWATDAHKTLNVPYDSGLVVVRQPGALRQAMSLEGPYLVRDDTGLGDPFELVPELSRRARGIPVWAALRQLGRRGVGDLVDGFGRHAAAIADGLRTIPGAEVLNDVVFTQVCTSFGSDERTQEVGRRLYEDGTTWMTGSHWRGRAILRVSVSGWRTTAADVERSVEAVRRAAS